MYQNHDETPRRGQPLAPGLASLRGRLLPSLAHGLLLWGLDGGVVCWPLRSFLMAASAAASADAAVCSTVSSARALGGAGKAPIALFRCRFV